MKMAMEGRLGKTNPRDWPHFWNRVIPPRVWQAFSERVGRAGRTDARWSAK